MEKYQTVGERFLAGIVDGLILVPIGVIDVFVYQLGLPKLVLITWLFISYSAGWIYFVFMHFRYGQTVGKMATAIKVLDIAEAPITLRQAFLRESIPIVINTMLLAFAIYFTLDNVQRNADEFYYLDIAVTIFIYTWIIGEVVVCLTNEKRRAIHDFIAGTVVVKLRALETKDDLKQAG